MSEQTKDTLQEIAQFSGKACGIIARDLAEISPPLTEAFRRGWRGAIEGKPAAQPAAASHRAPESA